MCAKSMMKSTRVRNCFCLITLFVVALVSGGGRLWGMESMSEGEQLEAAMAASVEGLKPEITNVESKQLGDRGKIIQYPALWQSDPTISYVDMLGVKNAVNLCGWYSVFFLKQLLEDDVEKTKAQLLERAAFNKMLKDYKDAGGTIEKDVSVQNLQLALTKSGINNYEIVTVYDTKTKRVTSFIGVKSFQPPFPVIINLGTAKVLEGNNNPCTHWIAAVFNVDLNDKITMYVADSLGVDRRNDLVVNAAFEWFVAQYTEWKKIHPLWPLQQKFGGVKTVLGDFSAALGKLVK